MTVAPDPRELPVACTLGLVDGMERMQRWQRLVDVANPAFDRADNRLTVGFTGGAGVLEELQVLAAAERECCAFLDWDVSVVDRPTLTITADNPEDLDAIAGQFGS